MGNFPQLVLKFLLLVLLFAQTEVFCQDITIINNYPLERGEVGEDQYVLSKVIEHTYVVNEFVPLQSGPRNQLNQMVSYGLRSYIDNQFFSDNGKLATGDDAIEFNKSASAIVRNAIWIHDHPFHDDFKTFSPGLIAKVSALKRLDGIGLKTGSMELSEPKNGSMNLYAFQRMVYEIKIAAEQEVAVFLDKHLGKSNNATSTLNTTTPDNTTAPLEEFNFRLEPVPRVADDLAALKPDLNDLSFDSRKGRRRLSEPYSAQIVELLEKNNAILENYGYRFEDLQNQINEIRNDRSGEAVRDEVKAMSEMIREVLSARQGGNPLAGQATTFDTPTVTIIFEKNESSLSIGHQAQLNMVLQDLILNPFFQALINGYADKTGDPEVNAKISRLRALAVKNYIIGQGISADRLIVSFLGDQESLSPNPADRKVEVTVIKN